MTAAPRKTPGQTGGSSTDLRLALKRTVEAPAIARSAASRLCEELGMSLSLQQTCVLLVSELVSNAVVHSSGPRDAPILLTATSSESALRIAVTDGGDGFTYDPARPTEPGRGYGLYLVEHAARRWGIDQAGDTRVWFELPRSS